jgi:regulator of protease activity HflC (stomatin/prohibitin superfamily)
MIKEHLQRIARRAKEGVDEMREEIREEEARKAIRDLTGANYYSGLEVVGLTALGAAALGAAGAGVIKVIGSPVVTVRTGEHGVRTRFGEVKRVNHKPGLHRRIWPVEGMIKVTTQPVEFELGGVAGGFTSDQGHIDADASAFGQITNAYEFVEKFAGGAETVPIIDLRKPEPEGAKNAPARRFIRGVGGLVDDTTNIEWTEVRDLTDIADLSTVLSVREKTVARVQQRIDNIAYRDDPSRLERLRQIRNLQRWSAFPEKLVEAAPSLEERKRRETNVALARRELAALAEANQYDRGCFEFTDVMITFPPEGGVDPIVREAWQAKLAAPFRGDAEKSVADKLDKNYSTARMAEAAEKGATVVFVPGGGVDEGTLGMVAKMARGGGDGGAAGVREQAARVRAEAERIRQGG